MKPLVTIPKTTLLFVLVVFVLALYAALRIGNLSQTVQKAKTTADTPSYVRISKEPGFGTSFLASTRPFVFPLVLKVFRNNKMIVWV
jgi:hypothetical protein